MMSDEAPEVNSVAWTSRATAEGAQSQARDGDPSRGADRSIHERSPRGVLLRLLQGNQRFLARIPSHTPDIGQALRVAERPSPAALVIGCIDSRVPPEAVFDQGFGDLLAVRTAGHVLDQVALASVELAVTKMRVPLIVVLGHECCAAVEYAVDAVHRGEQPGGALAYLVEQIAPSVPMDTSLSGTETYRGAVRDHITSVVSRVRAVPAVAQAASQGTLAVAGVCYDVTSGEARLVAEPA